MTTNPAAQSFQATGYVRLPDPPEPEDMNNNIFLHIPGNTHHLAVHFGNEDTTIIAGEAYISREPTSSRLGLFHPDLLIAFNVNPAASKDRNGYVISEQGKPPDFVLEIASASTGRRDVTDKRDGYAALGIPEYWRFDDSGGRHHGAPLAGDRLVDGIYQAVAIEQIDDRTHQGYSAVLDLYLRWEEGRLGWYDPATGRHIIRFRDEQERAETERERANTERERTETERERANTERERTETERERANTERERAETERERANTERERADRAEAHVRELEAELRGRQEP